MVSPDHTRNDMFKFGSTNDSGFEMSHNDMIHDNLISTGGHGIKKKKKNYTYMTLKNQDHKARSVSSNLAKLDHTCFI